MAACLQAQPAFDAASVRIDNGPYVPGVSMRMTGGPGTSDPGRFAFKQAPLKILITAAWGISPDQLSGPAWLNDLSAGNITITATLPPETTRDQFRLMLQNLLAERFHLSVHHETRNFPGHDLVVAPGGPRLKKWNPDAVSESEPDGFPRLQPGKPGNAVRFAMGKTAIVRSTNRQSMADFARGLGGLLNTSLGIPGGSPAPRVADKTGLTGIYEFTLEFEGTAVMPGMAPPPDEAVDPGSAGPTLFNALEKQLGLRLVKGKNVPVDVLIVDRVDKAPVEN